MKCSHTQEPDIDRVARFVAEMRENGKSEAHIKQMLRLIYPECVEHEWSV